MTEKRPTHDEAHAVLAALFAPPAGRGEAGSDAAGLSGPGWGEREPRPGEPYSEALLAEVAAVERLGRLIDARRTRLAGELAHRSRSELGDDGLARSQNFVTPAKLLAAVAGTSVREAQARIALGLRLRESTSSSGAVTRPFSEVGAALEAGLLGVEAASAVTRELGELARQGVDPSALAEAESTLVHLGCQSEGGLGYSADEVARLAVRVRDALDPDGVAPRAERMRELRGMTMSRSRDGMIRGRFALTPEQGAVWNSALQALVSPRVSPRFAAAPAPAGQAGPDGSEYALRDTRTGPQKLVDAATELIGRAAAAPEMPKVNGSAPTVNVHVSLADLSTERGAAWADGVDDPLPVAAVDHLLCHADVVPTVLGANGSILQHAKTRRLFSPAQNRALAVRDGGCVWPGCDRPPSYCETHHVDGWTSAGYLPGRTDVDNGVLLCHFHHANVHRSDWTLVMIHGAPHLIPPRWIDTAQAPRPCTRRRVALRPPPIALRPPRPHPAASHTAPNARPPQPPPRPAPADATPPRRATGAPAPPSSV